MPRAPKHLTAPTRRWFASAVAEYPLEPHHVRLLVLAGEAWDRCQQAREALKKHGLIYHDRFGAPRSRPEVAIERDARLAFARLVRELGLVDEETPDTRPPALRGRYQGRR